MINNSFLWNFWRKDWCLVCIVLLACLGCDNNKQPPVTRNLAVVPIASAANPANNFYRESYALIIGASKYNNGWSPLPGVPEDVAAVSAMLRQQGFAITEVLDPTRAALDTALRNFVKQYGQKQDNRLLIYFAGHGETRMTAPGVQLGYIVPVDAPRPNEDLAGFKDAAFSMDNIVALAKGMEAHHVLFLFDSCFAGSIFEARGSIPSNISEKMRLPVRQFITAGGANETVPDESIFRRQFINGIKNREADLNKDGFVTGSEIGLFLQRTVTAYSQEMQKPRFGTIMNAKLAQGDFVFALSDNGIQSSAVQPQEPVTPNQGANSATHSTGGAASGAQLPTPQPPVSPMAEPAPTFQDCEACPKMVRIPAGNATAAFALGETEVTQAQWQAIMNDNPSHFRSCGANCPVESINFADAQEYVRRLSAKTRKPYRLPTEQEWEYACSAGFQQRYCGSDLLNEVAWYTKNSVETVHRVKEKKENYFKLYDMSGNVWEWTASCGEQGCDKHVLRGGSWLNPKLVMGADDRYVSDNSARYISHGLRVALEGE